MAPPANVALLRVKLARADSDMTTCTWDAGVRGACVCVCVCVYVCEKGEVYALCNRYTVRKENSRLKVGSLVDNDLS